ncbi:uroporphyrinogen-III synthase [Vibrio ulleungensis]|uniref:Uroporphyrinogen-III synthase n=1 Tax=Vibrio ulleungensis TaxID=2807619 RepID=A0ABS2HLW2_9VIBR|nr:uroporphyrinogen-III synthase [Vibrio ulleungensis]MBM7037567.1 uroporphyrinogen-III synthase [Vibrio ulleungensis]
MSVLIIRPQQAANELAQQLALQGIQAIAFPLIEFSQSTSLSEGCLKQLSQADIIISVSKPASMFLNEWITTHHSSWPTSACYMAVGKSSAYCLQQFTKQQVLHPTVEDSEHLLSHPKLRSVDGRSIVILRGNSGRELLFQTLTSRGAHVSYIESYQRYPVIWDSESHFRHWQAQGVEKLVVTSAEQLKLLIKKANLDQLAWLQSRQLFVTSARISKLAQHYGFNQIIITHKADNQTLLQHIAR